MSPESAGAGRKDRRVSENGEDPEVRRSQEGVPDELIAIMDIPGMGPKTLAMIHKERKISNLHELEKAWTVDPSSVFSVSERKRSRTSAGGSSFSSRARAG